MMILGPGIGQELRKLLLILHAVTRFNVILVRLPFWLGSSDYHFGRAQGVK